MPYTTLRNFIAEAIKGEFTAEEVLQILDNIEQGIGLQEHEKQNAEAMGQLPACDEDDPVYLRGRDESAGQFVASIYPMLRSIESAGHGKMPVCPWCRAGGRDDAGKQLHSLGGCELDKMLTAMKPTADRLEEGAKERARAMRTDPSPLEGAVAKALD